MPRIFALTARGLEATSIREMTTLYGAVMQETGYRRVAADYSGSLPALLTLRTVDDVYFDLGLWDGVGHTRAALDDLRERAATLEAVPAAALCASIRPIRNPPPFSVSVSFVGKRNYSADEVKATIAAAISARTGWVYSADDREADLHLRLFIEHERVYIGLRVAASPLHDRAHPRIQRPGALKPSVAAALLDLCGAEAGLRLLDPCCGTGTILLEGAQLGLAACGGDVESEAVQAAQTNAASVGLSLPLCQWDARLLPLPDRSVDYVVSNLPWGRQVQTGDDLTVLYCDLCREMERVLVRGGRAALLTNAPDLLRFERLRLDERLTLSLFGQTPTAALYTAIR